VCQDSATGLHKRGRSGASYACDGPKTQNWDPVEEKEVKKGGIIIPDTAKFACRCGPPNNVQQQQAGPDIHLASLTSVGVALLPIELGSICFGFGLERPNLSSAVSGGDSEVGACATVANSCAETDAGDGEGGDALATGRMVAGIVSNDCTINSTRCSSTPPPAGLVAKK
jgi:hypothetical protein